MSVFFKRYSLILITGNHAPYIRAIAGTIKNTFKTNAIIFQGTHQPPISTLVKLPYPIILCKPWIAMDKDVLHEVRARGGLVVWTHKTPLLKANDLFIFNM